MNSVCVRLSERHNIIASIAKSVISEPADAANCLAMSNLMMVVSMFFVASSGKVNNRCAVTECYFLIESLESKP